MGQGFTLIAGLNSCGWMNSSVNHGNLAGSKALHQPVDHAVHPRDAAATGTIGQPNPRVASAIPSAAVLFSCQTRSCSRENTPISGPIGDDPVAGAVPKPSVRATRTSSD